MSSSASMSVDGGDEGYTKLREPGPGRRNENPTSMAPFVQLMRRTAAINNQTVAANANFPSLSEHRIDFGTINKVLASRWLNEHQVVIGTKCNQLIVVDITNNTKVFVPMLTGQGAEEAMNRAVHSIDISPCGSMLATSTENSSCLAVYKLPSFTPFLAGVGGHTDKIFDVKWVNSSTCMTGSRDSRLSLWLMPEHQHAVLEPGFINVHTPYKSVTISHAQKIRALALNQEKQEMGVTTTNGIFYLWDIETFQMKATKFEFSYLEETVCMSYSPQFQLYAVASIGRVHFLDMGLTQVLAIDIPMTGNGEHRLCRSLSFNRYVVTIGTSDSCLFFYDIHAMDYLTDERGNEIDLHASVGYMLHEDAFDQVSAHGPVNQAIFTHCYNESRTKLFTAGGPILNEVKGNYVAVWQ